MKVSLLTLGCRVNQSETAVIEGTLKESGITIVNLNENPDYCIVNTCTVTAKSDYNSRQLIRRAARAGAKVIVTGCYAQLRPDEVGSLKGVSNIVSNHRKSEIVRIITDKETDLYYGTYSLSRPYLKIQDGCNFKCSYCSVPLARGRSKSVPEEEVVERARIIEAGGYREIVLTGIHLGTYGHDLGGGENLNGLLKRILANTQSCRIRLSSLEINEIDDELMEIMQERRMCNHLHIPLQSGSDKLLKLMRRHYTADFYARRLRTIVSRVEAVSLGTDIITGFPGEGEAEFSETLTYIKDLPFSYLHVFPFSGRPDTEAFLMKNRPLPGIVRERIEKMKTLNSFKKSSYMKNLIGKTVEIILEEQSGKNAFIGTSSNYLKILLSCSGYKMGSIVPVRLTDIENGMLRGVVIRST